ncbi:S-adenosyl-L-methionine-dependent methyltransferase [Lipomyces japonicus]|uniref:S-adenosyl-L-methionine-dependent methyltransferase n=1 Tax=Lipomyces japonicus TaxID=56871 RepID=UPI0034CE9E26
MQACRVLQRSFFREGDVVLLKSLEKNSRTSYLTARLSADGPALQTRSGLVNLTALIGESVRKVVYSANGKEKFLATLPSYLQYVIHRTRDAQPIYALDAAALVALTDLHVDDRDADQVHVLEAGTGHGALTISIAQVLHSANANLPVDAKRNALLHSMDIKPKHLKTGKANLRAFRNGLYEHDVSFTCNTPSQFLAENKTMLLDAVFFDMASPEDEVGSVAQHLKTNAPVAFFLPSVTQILPILDAVIENHVPLEYEQVVEFSPGMKGNLRAWKVKRAVLKNPKPDADAASSCNEVVKWVCRPEVGELTTGGGFVLIMRKKLIVSKQETDEEKDEKEEEKEPPQKQENKTAKPVDEGTFISKLIHRFFGPHRKNKLKKTNL